jgi:Bacterial fructose-1,6-bisphosphatase, glpX-encoded
VILSMRASYHMFDLSLEMLRVVEEAATASAHTIGMGDAKTADRAAVESMRRSMDTVLMDGAIVIGEGEGDEAPVLYIGEEVGGRDRWATPPAVDIAVDPLEGTSLCATGTAGDHGVGRFRRRRVAARAGLPHGEDCGRTAGQGCGGVGCSRQTQSQGDCDRLQRGVDDLVGVCSSGHGMRSRSPTCGKRACAFV